MAHHDFSIPWLWNNANKSLHPWKTLTVAATQSNVDAQTNSDVVAQL